MDAERELDEMLADARRHVLEQLALLDRALAGDEEARQFWRAIAGRLTSERG